jgi:hypothetical protein
MRSVETVRNAMRKKSEGDGSKPESQKKKIGNKERCMSEYTAAQLPTGAVIDFVFHEDFNSDGQKEAAVGFTQFIPFPPESAVLLVNRTPEGFNHNWLSAAGESAASQGMFDNAVVADTNGDGRPELILSLADGEEHCICVYVFGWSGNGLYPVWHSPINFYHGSMEVDDIDNDGIAEIVIECGTYSGSEIIAMKDTCYHVREGCVFKWDGNEYAKYAGQVHMPYESYNTAVEFLAAIWSRDYRKAFDKVVMPGFIGLKGLDDSSLTAFKNFINKKVRPLLMQNLLNGKLVPSEPYNTCCQFVGSENYFTIELVREKNIMKVYGIDITKKSCLNN